VNDYERLFWNKKAWEIEYGLSPRPGYLDEFDELSRGKRKRLLLAPVGHGKSWNAVREVLHRICVDPNVRVLIVSKTLSHALTDARMVKTEIERNDKMRADYGLESSPNWGADSFTVKRPKNLKEPTVTAAGAYGQIEGLRLDYIVCDDLIDFEHSFSQVEREKIKNWFDVTLQSRLEPEGEILVIGTRWHPSDLYGMILERAEKVGTWYAKTYQAFPPTGGVLWSERWPEEKLEEKRLEEGETAFRLKFMNEAIALEGNLFLAEWLQFVEDKDLPSTFDDKIVGMDPATTTKELAKADPDATALVGIGIKDGKIYLLDIELAYTSSTHADVLNTFATRLDADQVSVEANAFQKLIVHEIHRKYPRFKVRSVEHYSKDKTQRILELQPRFQSGQILLSKSARNLERFRSQYLEFPNGSHDDILDALEIACKDIGKKAGAVVVNPALMPGTLEGLGPSAGPGPIERPRRATRPDDPVGKCTVCHQTIESHDPFKEYPSLMHAECS
jgi:predicted phage terminase large subunit-like protein